MVVSEPGPRTHSESHPARRIFGLDALRAAAILMVLASHTWPSEKAANWGFVPGVLGVEMFFVLSGFLIGGILLRLAGAGRLQTWGDLVGFWRRRWYRTLPNYFLFLFLQMAWRAWVLGYPDVLSLNWPYIVFIQNLTDGPSFFFPETWSLSIEEWFYLLFALLLWGTLRMVKRPDRACLIAMSIFLLAPFLYKIWAAFEVARSHPSLEFGRQAWDMTFRKAVAMRLDVLMYGVAAAFIAGRRPALWRQVTRLWWVGLGLIAVAVSSLALNWPLDYGRIWQGVLLWPCMALGFTLLLARASLIAEAKGWMARAISFVAAISYALYLCHGLVFLMLKQFLGLKSFLYLPKHTWSWVLAAWVFSFIIASLVHYLFEIPIMNLRDRPQGRLKVDG